ncbi:MAG: cell division protein FtsZ [Rickettsiales bacterium]|jgi:cell division protein FtsZ|nr:cell division protein FtsZ [Rickettsiales bacterium]
MSEKDMSEEKNNVAGEDDIANDRKSDEFGGEEMISNYELLNQKYKIKPPKIVVFGVGGGGCNAVNSMHNSGEIDESVVFVVANTDLQSLNVSNVKNKILLGRKTTGGFGAGCEPDVGRAAAEESLGEIENFLAGASMIFLTAGMGGGTGTGASPVIAKKAREMGILVAAIVTKPFTREGTAALKKANDGIAQLKKYADTLIIVPNQNLSKIANPKTTMQQSFAKVDEVLQSGVRSIVDLITKTGFINLDFADIRTIMKKMGRAVMGAGEASGPNRAVKAVENAISNPLLDNISLRGAKGVILNITSSIDLTFHEYDNATRRLNEEIGTTEDTIILHGNVFDSNMGDAVRVSIFATGIDENGNAPAGDPKEDKEIKSEKIEDAADENLEKGEETEYNYVEKKPGEEDGLFFDLGDAERCDDPKESKNDAKNSEYQKLIQKINQTAEAEIAAKGETKAASSSAAAETSKKRSFLGIFSIGKAKDAEPKKEETKSKKQEKRGGLSIVEVEDFDKIDIDVYEVPAYLRKKNE